MRTIRASLPPFLGRIASGGCERGDAVWRQGAWLNLRVAPAARARWLRRPTMEVVRGK